MLTYHRTTEEEKYNITSWKYEGKYSIYNEKPYEEHKRNHYGFANPKNPGAPPPPRACPQLGGAPHSAFIAAVGLYSLCLLLCVR